MTHNESHRRSVSPRDMHLSPAVSFAIAVAAPGLAALIRHFFDPLWGQQLPFITFYPAVMLAAWLGGLWPGIVATLLAAALADSFWLTPVHSLAVLDIGQVAGVADLRRLGRLYQCVKRKLAARRVRPLTFRGAAQGDAGQHR